MLCCLNKYENGINNLARKLHGPNVGRHKV